MTPATAAFVSLVLPGSAHFAMGRPARGALAAVVCLGLFWLGAGLLGGDRLYHMALVDSSASVLLGYLPINLLPEFFNLGSAEVLRFLTDTSSIPAGREMREPRELEHLLSLCTGLSGWLSLLFAADAHWFASQKAKGVEPVPAAGSRVLPGTALVATFFLPGLGQYLAGHKAKGVLVGASVLVLFFGAIAFAEGHAVDRPLQGGWWIGQSLCGGGAALAAVATSPLQMAGHSPQFLHLGIVMATCAGLVNVSGMLDAWRIAGGIRRRDADGVAPATSEPAPTAPAAGGEA